MSDEIESLSAQLQAARAEIQSLWDNLFERENELSAAESTIAEALSYFGDGETAYIAKVLRRGSTYNREAMVAKRQEDLEEFIKKHGAAYEDYASSLTDEDRVAHAAMGGRGPKSGLSEVEELSRDEGRELVRLLVGDRLGISLEDFLVNLDAGAYQGTRDEHVVRLAMLAPFAR